MGGATVLAAPLGIPAMTAGKRSKQPNVLLVMTDQQIADGYSRKLGRQYINTPVLDALAGRSLVHERAYAANPICMPSRTAIWSGRYPHETGIQTNDKAVINPRKFPTLGTVFSSAGYETAYVGKWHAAYPADDPAAHGFAWTDNMRDDGNGLDPATPAAAAEFLRHRHDKPFLLVASFNNPHNICEWARGDALPEGGIGSPPPMDECPPLPPNLAPSKNETDIMALMRRSYQSTRMMPVGNFGEKEWREYRWAYFRLIEKIDRQVGDVLQALEDSGEVENTVVVFLSDHGDMVGAHRWNQKTLFFDEAARVPLFFFWPGKIKPGTTRRLVNTGIDLFPTLCGIAGIPVPANLPGTNLCGAGGDRKYVVSANHLVQGAAVDGQKPEPNGRMVRSARYKYCVYDEGQQREALFDMEKDPGETINQTANPEYRAILDQHRAYFKEWATRYRDPFPVPGN